MLACHEFRPPMYQFVQVLGFLAIKPGDSSPSGAPYIRQPIKRRRARCAHHGTARASVFCPLHGRGWLVVVFPESSNSAELLPVEGWVLLMELLPNCLDGMTGFEDLRVG